MSRRALRQARTLLELGELILPRRITAECFGDLFDVLEEMAETMPGWRLQLEALIGVGWAVLFTLREVLAIRRLWHLTTERIHRPPGFKLRAIAEFVFSKRTYETVFEPVLRDLQDEHLEALADGRMGKARWVRIRGTWSFWAAVLAQTPISFIKWLIKRKAV